MRSRDGLKKHYRDTLKASMKDFDIPKESWEVGTQGQTNWRNHINKGTAHLQRKENL